VAFLFWVNVFAAPFTVPEDPAPKSAGEHLDKTTEATKSFMTSAGEQFNKTADVVKGVFPSTADTDPANKEVSSVPEEKKT